MDLQDPNAANSSLYMINAAVNSLKINYDEETDTFSVDYPSEPKPKVVCLDNSDRPCAHGNLNKNICLHTHILL